MMQKYFNFGKNREGLKWSSKCSENWILKDHGKLVQKFCTFHWPSRRKFKYQLTFVVFFINILTQNVNPRKLQYFELNIHVAFCLIFSTAICFSVTFIFVHLMEVLRLFNVVHFVLWKSVLSFGSCITILILGVPKKMFTNLN